MKMAYVLRLFGNGDIMTTYQRRRRSAKKEDNLCPISLSECDNPAGKSFRSCYYCGRFDAEQDRIQQLEAIGAIVTAKKAPEEKNQVSYSRTAPDDYAQSEGSRI